MYIYGKNVALEYLKKDLKIDKAYLYKNFNDEYIVSSLKSKKIKIEWLDKRDLDHLCHDNHQGIVLRVKEFEYSDIDEMINNNNRDNLCCLVNLAVLQNRLTKEQGKIIKAKSYNFKFK